MPEYRLKSPTMRRELSYYILGLALLTALMYTLLLERYFEHGLEELSNTSILIEARAFEQRYRQDPNASLPQSYLMSFYLDDWQQASAFHRQVVPFAELIPEQFAEIEWDPKGIDGWEGVHYLVAYRYPLFDGRQLYIVADYDADLLTAKEKQRFEMFWVRILYVGGAYLLVMFIVVFFYNRRVQRYTQQLSQWAEALTLESIHQPRPPFRYAELNRIAEQLQQAFERIAALLEREHQFLRHASHELRTPIAVIRANMELLERMGSPMPLLRPLERVRRANQGMQNLTETLLWLSREHEAAPRQRSVQLTEFVNSLQEDLAYLLQDKQVEVICDYAPDLPSQVLPITPLRIVVSNLLRNAFQYTHAGKVYVQLSAEVFCIENHEYTDNVLDHDNSFGLGLMLVKRICERLDWSLEIVFLEGGVRARLELPAN